MGITKLVLRVLSSWYDSEIKRRLRKARRPQPLNRKHYIPESLGLACGTLSRQPDSIPGLPEGSGCKVHQIGTFRKMGYIILGSL